MNYMELKKLKELLESQKDKILSTFVGNLNANYNAKYCNDLSLIIEFIQKSINSRFETAFNYDYTTVIKLIIELDTNYYRQHYDLIIRINQFRRINNSLHNYGSRLVETNQCLQDTLKNCINLPSYITSITILQKLTDEGLHKVCPEISLLDEAVSLLQNFKFTNVADELINLRQDLINKNFIHIIRNTRSLLESFHKHFLKKSTVANKDDCKEVLNLIEIINDDNTEILKGIEDIKTICEKKQNIIYSIDQIVNSLSKLRNNDLLGKAHGAGENDITPEENIAFLLVGTAITYINFVLRSPRKD